ncbi:MAG TPA: hypothetical protein VGG39_34020 [Polyangiaceae bacterium]
MPLRVRDVLGGREAEVCFAEEGEAAMLALGRAPEIDARGHECEPESLEPVDTPDVQSLRFGQSFDLVFALPSTAILLRACDPDDHGRRGSVVVP